jgi:nucleoside-triphosphatase THEP1
VEERKAAMDAADISIGEWQRLTPRRPERDRGLLTNVWTPDPKVVQWCNRILREAAPSDLLVVDELGSLEFQRGEGFLEGTAAVDAGHYDLALVVVRDELLSEARACGPHAKVLAIEHHENAPTAARELIESLTSWQ